jgi:hypothetical protein
MELSGKGYAKPMDHRKAFTRYRSKAHTGSRLIPSPEVEGDGENQLRKLVDHPRFARSRTLNDG